MREKSVIRGAKRWLVPLAVAGAAVVLVAGAWASRGEMAAPGNGEPKRIGVETEVGRDAGSLVEADVEPSGAALPFADLALRCSQLFHSRREERVESHWPRKRRALDDCQAALEAWFADTPAVVSIIALAAPLTWREVFSDVSQRLDRVLRRMLDPGCAVADGEIRADLAERCAARDMAVLAVFKDACGLARERFEPLIDFDHRFGLQEYQWFATWDEYLKALGALDAGRRFTGGIVNLERPERVEAALDERLVNSDEHMWQRRRLDEVYLRTDWLRSKCKVERLTLGRMAERPWTFSGLMGRAAALGDELALVDRPLDRGRALTLEKSDPMLAWLHLAVLDSEAAYAERDEAWERARRELADRSPHFENRRRLLELAGVACGEPCTREKLRAREIESRERRLAFRRQASEDCDEHDDCDLENTITALRKTLRDAEMAPERREAYWRIGLRYQKQRESARMKYALAVEALAEATGRVVDVQALRQQIADPSMPWFLDDSEVELARAEAQRLVAKALLPQASAAVDQAGANQRVR